MEKVLLTSNEYNGQYVALVSPEDNTIVGSGKTPDEALKMALQKGHTSPYLLYVPDKDSIHIYYAG